MIRTGVEITPPRAGARRCRAHGRTGYPRQGNRELVIEAMAGDPRTVDCGEKDRSATGWWACARNGVDAIPGYTSTAERRGAIQGGLLRRALRAPQRARQERRSRRCRASPGYRNTSRRRDRSRRRRVNGLLVPSGDPCSDAVALALEHESGLAARLGGGGREERRGLRVGPRSSPGLEAVLDRWGRAVRGLSKSSRRRSPRCDRAREVSAAGAACRSPEATKGR